MVKRQLDVSNDIPNGHPEVSKYVFEDVDLSGENEEKNKNVSKENKESGPPPVSFLSLFQYASRRDKILIAIGCLAPLLSGGSMPAIVVLLGDLLDTFVLYSQNPKNDEIYKNSSNATPFSVFNMAEEDAIMQGFLSEIRKFGLGMALIGVIVLFLNYIMVTCLSVSAENQAFRIRHYFMKAVVRQDLAWFDTHQTGDFASRATTDLNRIQDGIGEKIGMCVFFMSTTIVSFVVALVYGWKLTLVILSVMPILVISGGVLAKVQATLSANELTAYGSAGAVAEEVLSSIRTVVAFGGERKEIERYEKNLVQARKNGIKRSLVTSIGASMVWLCIYGSYALAFWYGVKLIIESREAGNNEYVPSTLIIVFFNVLMGAMNMGQASPYLEAFAIARGAAGMIFEIIERIPLIDSSSETGEKPATLEGNVEFHNVHFSYPARPDVPVLQGLGFEVKSGETVALVGASGCGKSTVVQLIQRFYDPKEGQVKIDGRDVRDLNIGWLRDHIGVVGQEPVLFATTIAENVRHGFPQSTTEDIERAVKSANAYDFINKLPKKYETLVGERGTQLSGGQKQRIAIARALVRNPKILLLDEATSALDTESESIVQAALDKARQGRSTVIVAHRLSTIRSADKIIVLSGGSVHEVGTHNELMEKKGLYHQLVLSQQMDIDDFGETSKPVKPQSLERQLSALSSTSIASEEAVTAFGRTASFKQSINNANMRKDSIEEKEKSNPSQTRLMKMTAPEWPYILTGCISSLLMGLSIPVFAIIFGEILQTLSNPDLDEVRKESTFYSLLFLAMGGASGIASFLQSFMFGIAGERLTLRIRKLCFTTMLKMDIGWFDSTKNNTGALCARLSSDAASVQGATGSRMSNLFQAFSTLVAGLTISFYYNWKLGLVLLCFVPLVLLATYFESRMISGQLLSEKSAGEEATKIAIEAIENIRTVASLHAENTFYSNYLKELTGPHKSSRKRSHLRGLTFGFSQSLPSFAYAAAMYYGGILISEQSLEYGDLFKVLEAVILGTAIVGQAVAFAPDYQKAKLSAVRIFKLLDTPTKIDSFSKSGLKVSPSAAGAVEFRSAEFSYPTRPEIKVLRNLNLEVEPGVTVALVGSSGCGKSTCIQLLERFYDCCKGSVMLDTTDVKELNVAALRSHIGIVSQEPVLFSYSIRENICYGDNSREVTMDEIISAARKANIHEFIKSLPAGYETSIGDRGSQLSGGQKQRVAIARALVRNPKLLLLDEATSALDAESEKIVQEALDKAREGRTCIIIAHRLSTIQNADQIFVIHHGRVVEKGKHSELLTKRGLYYKLHTAQVEKTD